MQKTNINYLTHTCNPLAMRCSTVSPGCANCWHLKLCDMHKKNPNLPDYVRRAKAGKIGPVLIEEELESMSVQGEPKRVGVQFMGDLFHDKVPADFIWQVYRAMSHSLRHTFLVLTKRPERLARLAVSDPHTFAESSPNIWLGVSCENQEWADKRIPHLLKIPAAVRWLSLEPLLSNIYIPDEAFAPVQCPACGYIDTIERYDVLGADYDKLFCNECGEHIVPRFLDGISWIVIGCESGQGRRPCKLEWVQSIVEQCKEAGVPCWVKQIEIDGKVETDVTKFPKELQVRELPK